MLLYTLNSFEHVLQSQFLPLILGASVWLMGVYHQIKNEALHGPRRGNDGSRRNP